MIYSLFIGRWQPFHKGHQWLIDTKLSKGYNVCIAVRDMQPDENNPLTSDEVIEVLEFTYRGNKSVKIIKIPDIESVNYGRGVGYKIIEHEPPVNIYNISATEIRRLIEDDNESWKDHVDFNSAVAIEEIFKRKIRGQDGK